MLRRISQLIVAPLIAALVFPIPALAADHVVSNADVSTRLVEAAAARQANIAELNKFLVSPVGLEAARMLGVDTARTQARLAHLSDSEARDLARRSRALTTDPASGLSTGAIVAIVLGGVAVTALLIWAAYESEDDDYDFDY